MSEQVTISTMLEAEHRWIDERFEQFSRGLAMGLVKADTLQEAASVLHRHIYLEEEFLFPEVEARGLEGPTAVMVQEHGDICRFLNGITELIGEGVGHARIQDSFKALRRLLEEHNVKEEGVLYPSADRLLNSAELVRRLKEANAPDGWACRAHHRGDGV